MIEYLLGPTKVLFKGLDQVRQLLFLLFTMHIEMRVWECYTWTEFGGVCLTVTLYQDHQLYHWASWSFGPPPRAHLRWDFTFRPAPALLWSTYSSSANCSLEVWEIKKKRCMQVIYPCGLDHPSSVCTLLSAVFWGTIHHQAFGGQLL